MSLSNALRNCDIFFFVEASTLPDLSSSKVPNAESDRLPRLEDRNSEQTNICPKQWIIDKLTHCPILVTLLSLNMISEEHPKTLNSTGRSKLHDDSYSKKAKRLRTISGDM